MSIAIADTEQYREALEAVLKAHASAPVDLMIVEDVAEWAKDRIGNAKGNPIAMSVVDTPSGAWAERESAQYLRLNPEFQRVGEWTIVAMPKGQAPVSGSEVWSMVYLDKRSGEEFYREHYKELEVPADDEG